MFSISGMGGGKERMIRFYESALQAASQASPMNPTVK